MNIPVCLSDICSWHLLMGIKKTTHFARIWCYKGLISLHLLPAEWRNFSVPIAKLLLCCTVKLSAASDGFLDSKCKEGLLKKTITASHVRKAVWHKLGRECVKSEWAAEAFVDKEKVFGDIRLSIQHIRIQHSSMKHQKWTVVYCAI